MRVSRNHGPTSRRARVFAALSNTAVLCMLAANESFIYLFFCIDPQYQWALFVFVWSFFKVLMFHLLMAAERKTRRFS